MSWRSWCALPILILSFVGVVTIQRDRLAQLQQAAVKPTLAELEANVEQERLRLSLRRSLPAFGFDNVFADWVLIQFFQYFGDDEARAQTDYSLTLDYYELALRHKPHFVKIYPFLGTSGTMYAADPERTDQLMAQGIAQMTPTLPPFAYIAVQNKAVNELLFLPEGGIRAQTTFDKAAAWASVYDDEISQGAVQFATAMSQALRQNPDSRLVRLTSWQLILQSVPDERSQAIAIKNIQNLGGIVSQTTDGRWQVSLPPDSDN